MPRVEIIEEHETAHGWRHTVRIDPAGPESEGTSNAHESTDHTVTLSFQDYELWSGGSEPPATITKRLVQLLLSGRIELAPRPLPESFDAARARRWGGVDELLIAPS